MKKLITIISTLVLTAICATGFIFKDQIKHYFLQKPSEQYRMTIFVHGSFGTMLGFLSFSDVLQDKISGTAYRNLNKKMRMDDFFFKDQPILQRGLHAFNPTFSREEAGGKLYAIYPITAAYDMLWEKIHKQSEKQLYYAFGWTGLISQSSRRFEAIRFYNALAQELDKLAAEGIKPSITIIAHSHGGNLALNLAAVNRIVHLAKISQEQTLSSDPDEQESLKEMIAVFSTLDTKQEAAKKPDQKAFDYIPQKRNLVIDELVMLGTPIQPETESFALDSTFKTVFNIYSDEDMVQKADWVSSKKGVSKKLITKKSNQKNSAKVIQIKIRQQHTKQQEQPEATPQEQNLLEQILGTGLFKRSSNDPTHKELWFANWQNGLESEFKSVLSPLPTVVITPFLVAQKHIPKAQHFDFEMSIDQGALVLNGSLMNGKDFKVSYTISPQDLAKLKDEFEKWRPIDTSSTKEFDVIYKLLIN